VRLVAIDAWTVPDIDVTASRMLGELQEEFAGRGVRLVVAEALTNVRDLLVGDELKVDFTEQDVYDTVDEAVAAVRVGPAES
jgi:MFS superfamily sulfate permease-like transporter